MSEEEPLDRRPLPASPTKIRRLRERGSVPVSTEFRNFVRSACVILALVLIFGGMIGSWMDMMQRALATPLPADGSIPLFDLGPVRSAMTPVAALLVVSLIAFLVAAFLDARGFVLGLEQVAFNLANVNPAAGIKKVFGLDALVEILRGLAKLIAYAAAGVFAFILYANDALWSPTCGASCQFSLTIVVCALFAACHLAILAISALVDLKVSRLLFLRQNRMSRKDKERENRDNYGSPEVKREVRRAGEDDEGPVAPAQQKNISLVLTGAGQCHALYVDPYSSSPCVVVARETLGATNLPGMARAEGVLVAEDESLSTLLVSQPTGAALPEGLSKALRQFVAARV